MSIIQNLEGHVDHSAAILDLLLRRKQGLQPPEPTNDWLVKGQFWIDKSTFQVVHWDSGEVRQGVLQERSRKGKRGEIIYQYVVFSLKGKTQQVYFGRKASR
jgi:hypothetical protein